MSRARRWVTAGLLATALAVVGPLSCQQLPPPPLFSADVESQTGLRRPSWPRAPAEKRVAYLGQLSTDLQLEAGRSFLRRVWDWMMDRGPDRFVRPLALAVHGERLAVADPGQAGVHLIDFAARSWITIKESSEGALASPIGVALLPDGRLLVSDSVQNAVWAFDARGRPAGRFTDEPLQRPTGLALDASAERLWLAETLAHRVRAFDLSGHEVARVGERGTERGQFNYPIRLSSDGRGGLWVTDSLNFRIQHLAPSGEVDRLFGMAGTREGAFARPGGLTVDAAGRVFVVDLLFDTVQIFDPQGQLLLSVGGRGIRPGQFSLPSDVVLQAGRLYVADSYNQRVQVFEYVPPAE